MPKKLRHLLLFGIGAPLLFGLLLFLPAGNIGWARGWLFILVVCVSEVLSAFYLWRTDPERFTAQNRSHEKPKSWDKALLCFIMPLQMAMFPVAALDDGRFHWSHIPLWLTIVGYVLLLASTGVATWARIANPFAAPFVRIQTDRGHRVIDKGPYRLVRHPFYLVRFFSFPGIAWALGSWWALVPAAITAPLLLVRTALEDRMLQEELPGYREYARRVRYRLIRGIW
jgi:protein-S-isoprenylcysteine O-methyltransferase Ste14